MWDWLRSWFVTERKYTYPQAKYVDTHRWTALARPYLRSSQPGIKEHVETACLVAAITAAVNSVFGHRAGIDGKGLHANPGGNVQGGAQPKPERNNFEWIRQEEVALLLGRLMKEKPQTGIDFEKAITAIVEEKFPGETVSVEPLPICKLDCAVVEECIHNPKKALIIGNGILPVIGYDRTPLKAVNAAQTAMEDVDVQLWIIVGDPRPENPPTRSITLDTVRDTDSVALVVTRIKKQNR